MLIRRRRIELAIESRIAVVAGPLKDHGPESRPDHKLSLQAVLATEETRNLLGCQERVLLDRRGLAGGIGGGALLVDHAAFADGGDRGFTERLNGPLFWCSFSGCSELIRFTSHESNTRPLININELQL